MFQRNTSDLGKEVRCQLNECNIIPFAPNLVSCCIDEYRPGRFQGRLYCSNVKETYRFEDMNNMLLRMDDYFDEMNFPMKAMEQRSFPGSQQRTQVKRALKKAYDPGILAHRGKKATFIIHVQYRQNCSWQGRIVWADQNKAQCFRSELEMIRLIDSALAEDVYNKEALPNR